MKINSKKIFYCIIITVWISLSYFGYFTQNLIFEIEHGKPRYEDRIQNMWNGKIIQSGHYKGEVMRNGIKYKRYAFHTYLQAWPNVNNYSLLEVMLPMDVMVEPIINYVRGNFSSDKTTTTIYIHTNSDLNLDNIPNEVVNYERNRIPPTIERESMFEKKDYHTIICLYITKEGIGSKIMAGKPNGSDFVWDGPFELTTKPAAYKGGWWSPDDRFAYAGMILTIPIDAITMPIQIPLAILFYNMNRGMSPR